MITFLLTDIEGSTRLVQALGDDYRQLLAVHHRLLGDTAAEHGGTLHGTEGDALFFWFSDAESAVAAAADGQRALADHGWGEGREVRVGMGIHSGEGVIENGEPIGLGIHRAARICAIGHGGQVLVSEATKAEAGRYAFKDLGSRRLKDFDEPVRVHQLVAAGLRQEFPPLRPSQPLKQKRLLLVAGLLIAAAIVAAAVIARPASPGVKVQANSVVAVDARKAKATGDIPVGQSPIDVAYGEGRVWVIHQADQTGTAIDAKTRKPLRTFSTIQRDDAIAAGAAGVLASHSIGASLFGYRPSLGEVIDPDYYDSNPVEVPHGSTRCTACWSPFDVAVGGAGAWETANLGTVQIDLATRKVTRIVSEVAPQIGAIAVGDRTVWVIELQTPGGGGSNGGIFVINAKTASAETPINAPIDVASDGDTAWILTANDTLDRVDHNDHVIAHAQLPTARGVAITTGGGSIWAATDAFDLLRIDPATLRVTKTIHLHHKLSPLAYGKNTVWVTVL